MKPLIPPDKSCFNCTHRRLKQIVLKKFHQAIWRCTKRDIEFGDEAEWQAGLNQPAKCKDFET
jgi:hypothetical protein